MSSKPPSKSVFIGNIPYGLTEEQIVRLFSSAGKVLNFRLVYDRETGRPKGFGFAEYPDQDSAASAVRNLNDYEIMNRKLRVDYSNDAGDDNDNTTHNPPDLSYQHNAPLPSTLPIPHPQNGYQPNQIAPPPQNSSLPPLPLGVDLPPGLTCPDAISRTLQTLPPPQLLDVLSQMKTLATTDPAKATELLSQAPQLSYAIFQALLLMGLVSTEALSSVVEQASAPAGQPPNAAAPVPVPTPMQNQQYPVPPPGGFAGGYPPQQQHLATGTPPVRGGQSYPPPPPQQQQPAPQAPPIPAGPEAALIQQVLAMDQATIDSLPPLERQQLMDVRALYGGGR